MFPLPKPYVFGKNEWGEKYLGGEKYMPKTFKLNFLQDYNQTSLSEKENKLLNRDFGYKNIDELAFAFNNTKTDEERDELFWEIILRNVKMKLDNCCIACTDQKIKQLYKSLVDIS